MVAMADLSEAVANSPRPHELAVRRRSLRRSVRWGAAVSSTMTSSVVASFDAVADEDGDFWGSATAASPLAPLMGVLVLVMSVLPSSVKEDTVVSGSSFSVADERRQSKVGLLPAPEHADDTGTCRAEGAQETDGTTATKASTQVADETRSAAAATAVAERALLFVMVAVVQKNK